MDTDLLLNALRIIASPYSVQKEYYPDFALLGDEIVGELDCIEFLEEGAIDLAVFQKLKELDNAFIDKSFGEVGYSDYIWTDRAVEHDVFWENQRNRAKEILKDLGCEYTLPKKFQ